MVPRGEYVGYDCTEQLRRNTKLAIIPIGYWHGYDRSLSSVGEVLIRGKRARVLGRVCMDLIVVDATDIPCKPGDTATLIGTQGKHEVTAYELGKHGQTTHYEILTRLNPLIERVIQ
jgi:alanine racemase